MDNKNEKVMRTGVLEFTLKGRGRQGGGGLELHPNIYNVLFYMTLGY